MSEYQCQNGDDVRIGGVYYWKYVDDERILALVGFKGAFGVSHSGQTFDPANLTSELARDADGYYIWNGGAQPVPDEWVVNVKVGGGIIHTEVPARTFCWDYMLTYGIAAFKVVSTGQVESASYDNPWPELSDDVNDQVYSTPSENIVLSEFDQHEYTGSSVNYYKVLVVNPTTIADPYEAECNDIIEALGMNYAEGNAFKAIWRKCAARKGHHKAGYDDGLYDAEKVVFFGKRMVTLAGGES